MRVEGDDSDDDDDGDDDAPVMLLDDFDDELGRPVGIETRRDPKKPELKGGMLKLDFLDSVAFMPAALSSLVEEVVKTDRTLMRNVDAHFDAEHASLLLRKGVFPYEWFDCEAKLDHTELPPIESFYSKLRQEGVSAADYAHAQDVWIKFGCKTFRDYMLLYLKGDVLQLADVCESFREVCQDAFGLECFNYVSAPGLAQDACFKTTQAFRDEHKINIELIHEGQADMLHLIERRIRGGISMITHCHAEATPAAQESPATEIRYLDANNLYGWSMSQKLPTGDFKWLSDQSVEDVLAMDCAGDRGAFVECDLHVPPELHLKFNDYPVAPETMMVDGDMVSP